MADFVIGTSVVMGWCLVDEDCAYGDKVLESLESAEAIAPVVWPLEIGNLLVEAERRKQLNKSATIRFLDLLDELPIIVVQEPPERMTKEILALGRERQISTCDASYLDLAMRTGLPIDSLDSS